MSFAMRLRRCIAKCGVEAPISWRTSSTVTECSGRRRWGCSASAIGRRRLLAAVDRLDLEQRIDPRLDRPGDRVLVTEQPAVVVHAAGGVLVVSGLDVQQV